MLIRLSEHLKVVKALEVPMLGTVVDNEDPLKLGRVKCTIPGIFEAEKEKLPWVMSEYDPTRLDVPEVGASLKIEFQFNDIYSPVFTGYWHSELNHDAAFDDDYPNTFGFIKQGLKFLYNKTSKILQFVHPSGTLLNIDGDGNVLIESVDNVDITGTGNVTIKGDGGVEVTSDGTGKFIGKGGTTVGDSGSTTKVDGSIIMLAGGGPGVALLGSQCIGTGNMGSPVISVIVDASAKVLAAK